MFDISGSNCALISELGKKVFLFKSDIRDISEARTIFGLTDVGGTLAGDCLTLGSVDFIERSSGTDWGVSSFLVE